MTTQTSLVAEQCPHYYQENLFSVMGTPNSIESEQFLLQVKKKGTNHVQ